MAGQRSYCYVVPRMQSVLGTAALFPLQLALFKSFPSFGQLILHVRGSEMFCRQYWGCLFWHYGVRLLCCLTAELFVKLVPKLSGTLSEIPDREVSTCSVFWFVAYFITTGRT